MICMVLVMGVDCGILVKIDEIVELFVVVKILKGIVEVEFFELVFFGK